MNYFNDFQSFNDGGCPINAGPKAAIFPVSPRLPHDLLKVSSLLNIPRIFEDRKQVQLIVWSGLLFGFLNVIIERLEYLQLQVKESLILKITSICRLCYSEFEMHRVASVDNYSQIKNHFDTALTYRKSITGGRAQFSTNLGVN